MKCEYCGKEFEQSTRGRKKKYCSQECNRSADRDHKRMVYVGTREKTCKQCRKDLPKYKTRFCSEECKRKYNHIKTGAISHPEILTKTCVVCGKYFQTWKSRQNTCSLECSKRAHYSDYRTKDKIIDKDITLDKLIQRDKYVCQICGGLVDLEDYEIKDQRKICGNYYPSRDHIIPLSKGGKHAWNNIQLAHRICNSKKRDKIS